MPNETFQGTDKDYACGKIGVGEYYRRKALEKRLQELSADKAHLRKLLKEVWTFLKQSGNCMICLADQIDRVTPGAKANQNRRHGHPKNCLYLRLKKEFS